MNDLALLFQGGLFPITGLKAKFGQRCRDRLCHIALLCRSHQGKDLLLEEIHASFSTHQLLWSNRRASLYQGVQIDLGLLHALCYAFDLPYVEELDSVSLLQYARERGQHSE